MRLALAAALLASLFPAPARAAAPAAPSPWTACGGELAGQQCRNVSVPLDHARPGGPRITLAVSRVPHAPGGRYQGVLLVNPGGPGGSGRRFAFDVAAALSPDLRQAYDVIGFDPRGVGASRPALRCMPRHLAAGRPPYDQASGRWLKRSRAYAGACARRHGALLAHMTTLDSARDLDRIRAALGVQRINYYGGSYGTYLGAVYATKYPRRVRRMILDSNVRPSRVWYRANLDQDTAFQRNVTAFLAWTAGHHRVYRLGRTRKAVERRFYATRRALDAHPLRAFAGNEFTDLMQVGGYATAWWPTLAEVWSAWSRDGDASGMLGAHRFIAAKDDNEYAVYNAVGCTDARWPRRWARWKRDSVKINRRAPFTTWQNTWFNAPCLFWPVPARKPVRITARTKILLLQATGDAATPYAGGLEMHRLLRGSRLVVEDGGRTHVIGLSGNSCVDARVRTYLRTGALPRKGITRCGHLPAPKPSRSS
ncbi:alpha/beta hydrolase [Actinocorallia longicatena]|uniref:Alpha/beta hydrolase n=1 Tax=Actinocorallia longicatena TaxID=111803 RepID=A0ABP6PZA7_9ACTN